MRPQSTHTKQSRQSRYVAGSSRGRHSATTLLAQVADIERGQRIRERREELHLTQPAVVDLLEELAWKLPREHSLHPETAADEKGKDRPQPPLTLRGLQTYERGGGILWEKAKLLAQILRMDVQEMMSGEAEEQATPDLSRPAVEPALTEILAAINAQLAEQTKVLARIEQAISRDQQARAELDESAERLQSAVAAASRVLRAETQSPAAASERPAK